MLFVARISNEHASLPLSELKAVIDAEPINIRFVDSIEVPALYNSKKDIY